VQALAPKSVEPELPPQLATQPASPPTGAACAATSPPAARARWVESHRRFPPAQTPRGRARPAAARHPPGRKARHSCATKPPGGH
jgi:hypothetical protein